MRTVFYFIFTILSVACLSKELSFDKIKNLESEQLSNNVFLLQVKYYPTDRSLWEQTFYLADFQTGSFVLLSKSQSGDKLVHIRTLRIDPQRKEAALLRYGQGTDKNTFIHVDLKTLKTKDLCVLPRTTDTLGFSGPGIKISPDFKFAAAMIINQEIDSLFYYSLRIIELQTLKITELDNNIMVEISPISSIHPGHPPFEWVSNKNILYQNMLPQKSNETSFRHNGEYVLKCIDIKTKKVEQWAKKIMPLTLDGGKINYDWFTGEIWFHDFIVDANNHTLIPPKPVTH